MAVSSCSPPNSSGGSRGGGSGLDRVTLLGWRWEETAASSWAPILLGLKHVGLLGIAFGWQRSFVVSLSALAKPGAAVLVVPRLSCLCFVVGRQIASLLEQFPVAFFSFPVPKNVPICNQITSCFVFFLGHQDPFRMSIYADTNLL